MKKIFLTLSIALGLMTTQYAQDFHLPAPSPSININQQFSTSFIGLNYSRPAVKGRIIFGDLIPFGQVWRTGANAATKVSFGEDVIIGGKTLPKGEYALYTIPQEKKWTILFNKGTKNWGSAGYKEADNILSVEVNVLPLNEIQENFTITLENISENSADLELIWEKTKVILPIKADNHQAIIKYFDKELKGKNPPYADAAKYYLANDYQLDLALEYADKAIKQNPQAFYLFWTKAQIQEKLGKHEEAVESAKKAAEIAKNIPAFSYEYQKKYEDLRDNKK
ncbi:MAG: DUF2911 domain-containing protein [Brumimicrobium sp.]|nr:DUF2911 domain-containing protein [Brumimicrobium sp.]MCO5268532.1 DUF2911 domain-containing protein [Brumimicrobium sp.]